MKLLLDENLSRRIVPSLQEAFPETTQVALVGLEQASDRDVWEFGKTGGYTILSKDEDFLGLLSTLGHPPRLILLALGNCTNQQVVDAMIEARAGIEASFAHDDVGFVQVYRSLREPT